MRIGPAGRQTADVVVGRSVVDASVVGGSVVGGSVVGGSVVGGSVVGGSVVGGSVVTTVDVGTTVVGLNVVGRSVVGRSVVVVLVLVLVVLVVVDVVPANVVVVAAGVVVARVVVVVVVVVVVAGVVVGAAVGVGATGVSKTTTGTTATRVVVVLVVVELVVVAVADESGAMPTTATDPVTDRIRLPLTTSVTDIGASPTELTESVKVAKPDRSAVSTPRQSVPVVRTASELAWRPSTRTSNGCPETTEAGTSARIRGSDCALRFFVVAAPTSRTVNARGTAETDNTDNITNKRERNRTRAW
jgi:hypothetical protein